MAYTRKREIRDGIFFIAAAVLGAFTWGNAAYQDFIAHSQAHGDLPGVLVLVAMYLIPTSILACTAMFGCLLLSKPATQTPHSDR